MASHQTFSSQIKHKYVQPNLIWLDKFVTGPVKRDQVGTKYTLLQNGTYFEFLVQYLLSVSCKTLAMKLFTGGINFTYIALTLQH